MGGGEHQPDPRKDTPTAQLSDTHRWAVQDAMGGLAFTISDIEHHHMADGAFWQPDDEEDHHEDPGARGLSRRDNPIRPRG
ncbi:MULTISPECIES: hypothetical protein [unclassified Streptomyces]|uniref:hypothetical protein n=1 Tax=unclassified Streptomyces TaxID=2593676 RepID=UPI0023656995|nr:MULTISPECIES: hypothetical protein [unclassified Streptomyces]MDF3141490.1 hypothetical protein [Streptomyces sp. T21Q-yed]WDF45029.1 hypothetical protein PBV52_50925 [Streptomyces sp. T12]